MENHVCCLYFKLSINKKKIQEKHFQGRKANQSWKASGTQAALFITWKTTSMTRYSRTLRRGPGILFLTHCRQQPTLPVRVSTLGKFCTWISASISILLIRSLSSSMLIQTSFHCLLPKPITSLSCGRKIWEIRTVPITVKRKLHFSIHWFQNNQCNNSFTCSVPQRFLNSINGRWPKANQFHSQGTDDHGKSLWSNVIVPTYNTSYKKLIQKLWISYCPAIHIFQPPQQVQRG